MNKWHSVLIICAIAFAIGTIRFLPNFFDTKDSGLIPKGSIHERMLRAQITVPDFNVQVTLENGQAEFNIPSFTDNEGNALGGDVLGIVAVGDPIIEVPVLNSQGETLRKDIVVPLIVNGGGTGSFLYLVILNDTGTTLIQKDYLLLGDRVQLNTVDIVTSTASGMNKDSEYAIKYSFLDRKSDEPFSAEPTVKKHGVIQISQGKINK